MIGMRPRPRGLYNKKFDPAAKTKQIVRKATYCKCICGYNLLWKIDAADTG
jgi:hypothetical protein